MQNMAYYSSGRTKLQEANGLEYMYESLDSVLTKTDLQVILEEAQRQKRAFEKENEFSFLNERKRALYD